MIDGQGDAAARRAGALRAARDIDGKRDAVAVRRMLRRLRERDIGLPLTTR